MRRPNPLLPTYDEIDGIFESMAVIKGKKVLTSASEPLVVGLKELARRTTSAVTRAVAGITEPDPTVEKENVPVQTQFGKQPTDPTPAESKPATEVGEDDGVEAEDETIPPIEAIDLEADEVAFVDLILDES